MITRKMITKLWFWQEEEFCRWLYNHNTLHAMMRVAIGGELVKWNATQFGTNYMFLESMHRQRDKFMTWMASPSFLESRFANTDEERFAHSCLSSLTWWEAMQFVLKRVRPLYAFLHFANQDKVPNLSEVLYGGEWIWKSDARISHWHKEVLGWYPTTTTWHSISYVCECR
jgi:hypothetical protein